MNQIAIAMGKGYFFLNGFNKTDTSPTLSHQHIPDPITLSKEIEYTYWQLLSGTQPGIGVGAGETHAAHLPNNCAILGGGKMDVV